MNARTAAQQLAWTLKATPGFLGVATEGDHGRETIVLFTAGGKSGLRDWFGFPVRTEGGAR